MASPHPEFIEFVERIGLGTFTDHFHSLRVETVDDLQDVTEDELEKMGMNSIQIRRFLRKVKEELHLESSTNLVSESSTVLPFTPTRVRTECLNQLIKRQSTRTSLQISYKLLTELNPQPKCLNAPFNSEKMHYFDLVNMICEQERAILGTNLTVELYTREGYPLAIDPSCYISKLSDWCLETYDTILLYAVPRPRAFIESDKKYSASVKRLNGNEEVIYLRNEKEGFGPIAVGVNCKEVIVDRVKEYIYTMTSLPPSCFKLIFVDTQLENGEKTLQFYCIKDQSVIDIVTVSKLWLSSWDQNFFVGACLSTWSGSQSAYGTSMFYSTLYALSEWFSKQVGSMRANVLGHIRSMTGCHPLIHALKVLFGKECLSLPHRVAIQELLMLVFKSIRPKPLKGDAQSSIAIREDKILEETNKFWAYFIDYAQYYHVTTEKYTTFNLCCSIKNNRMLDPNRVVDDQGIPHIVDKQSCRGQIEMEMFQPLPEYVRLIKSFRGFEAQVWNVKEMIITEVDLTRECRTIESKLTKYPILCVQLPLSLKENKCPVPCMTFNRNGMLCNYIGPSKNETKPYEGFDPIDGETFNFDADDLDEELRKRKFPQFSKLLQQRATTATPTVDFATITRPLNEIEELIMVVLDASSSMDKKYFANKTKYELAMTGFEQFCNRTTAYNFKNMIGLVIFGGDSKVELELTESFRHFSSHIKTFPDKGSTAIFDAIVYSVNYLNSFKLRHGLSNTMPIRILCLTDGGDNASKTKPIEASISLIGNNIIMDSILLCEGKVTTHVIAKQSGGFSFQPRDQKELLRIFENETMLNLACRKFKTHLENTLKEALLIPYDTDPEFLHPDKLTSTFQTSEKCLADAVLHKIVTSQVSAVVTKRILRELAYLQTNPHPSYEVFPCCEALDFWHLMLEAPKHTPYENGIFRMYIEFTKDYPQKPPNIRFITPIYHCNINNAGRICHKILDRFYSSEKKIREILDHVYGLLLEATPDDPLDSYKATLLRTNKAEYDNEAKLFTQLHACTKTKRDVRIEILGGNPDIRDRYPAQFVCPLTLHLFRDPVLTCHGETYEREAIIEYLENVAEQDPYSFKPLQSHQLFPNNNLLKGVQEFSSKLGDL